MPLGTLDGTAPSFFRQGPSALSKLVFFSALALFLMVADVRLQIVQPLRVAIAAALYPVQWLALQPVLLARHSETYFESLKTSQANEEEAHRKLDAQSQRANQVEQLLLENTRLRELLGLHERLTTPSQAAQVLYDTADAYTRKVIIDKGSLNQVIAGSPVLDEAGVLGQVTRVYAWTSEVTLITDRNQAIPVLNTRTGARGVAFGNAALHSVSMELRFMAADADVQVGDLLTTSGVDGIYPPGIPVARVVKVELRVDSAFLRITCKPLAFVTGIGHVMVLTPLEALTPTQHNTEDARPIATEKGQSK